jgi:integrase
VARIDAVRLRDITPDKVQQWKVRSLNKAGDNPAKRRSAIFSVNSTIRLAKSLFSPKILKFVIVDMPFSSPFEGVQFEKKPSTRYQSSFKVEELIGSAQAELPQEQFKIFLLALMVGLRRNEIDKLEWSAFNWSKNVISIRATEYFHPKSEDSTGDVEVDAEVMELFRGFQAKATANFVIECPIPPRPEARYSHYRCQNLFQRLAGWLHDHGVEGGRPIHTLRKEYGSQVNAKHGIYAASRALRHADIGITNQHYLDRRQSARAGLGVFLRPSANVIPITVPGEKKRRVG